MRLLAGNDSEMLDELNPEAAEFLKSFTELRLLSESSGTPFNRVMVPLLLSEGHEGFCVDPKGKMILRKISLVIATGESPWDAIRFVLGLPEGKRIHPEVAIIMLKEELKEEELSEILELSVNFFNWGGNYCDFLEFLAGKNKL